MNLPKLPKKLPGGRKFWLSLIAASVAFGNSFFNWGFSAEQVWAVILPLMGFVTAEGVADVVERANGK